MSFEAPRIAPPNQAEELTDTPPLPAEEQEQGHVENVDKAHAMALAGDHFMTEAARHNRKAEEQRAIVAAIEAADSGTANPSYAKEILRLGSGDYGLSPADRRWTHRNNAIAEGGRSAARTDEAEKDMQVAADVYDATNGDADAIQQAVKARRESVSADRLREKATAWNLKGVYAEKIKQLQNEQENLQAELAAMEASGPTKNPIKAAKRLLKRQKLTTTARELEEAKRHLADAQKTWAGESEAKQ